MKDPREREESIAVCKLWDLQSFTCNVPAVSTATDYLTEPSGEQSLAQWLQWKACLEAVITFGGEPVGIKLCAG